MGCECPSQRAWADYWVAYRLTFATDEQIIVAPTFASRYDPYDRTVRASAVPPAYIFVIGSQSYRPFLEWCRARSANCEVTEQGQFALVRPSEHLLPEDFPPGWPSSRPISSRNLDLGQPGWKRCQEIR